VSRPINPCLTAAIDGYELPLSRREGGSVALPPGRITCCSSEPARGGVVSRPLSDMNPCRPLLVAVNMCERRSGLVDRIGMAMHDLPLAALAPEDRRAAEHVRRRFGAADAVARSIASRYAKSSPTSAAITSHSHERQ
jgi:hypothetical protein